MITGPDDERSGGYECRHLGCDSRPAAPAASIYVERISLISLSSAGSLFSRMSQMISLSTPKY